MAGSRNRRPGWAAGIASLFVLFDPAAAADEGGALRFARTAVCIARDGISQPWRVDVELADTHELRARGLMYRRSLAPNAGMLFQYPETQAATTGFWMPHVPFALDIAFLDQDGVVLATRTMAACPDPERSPCPTYPADVPYRSALEVNAGQLLVHQVVPQRARLGHCGDTQVPLPRKSGSR